jgi:predicted nucleic acid-binding protein
LSGDFIPAEDYLGAIELVRELKMDPNDCLAGEVMKREGVHEIYTFDSGFDSLTEKLP